MRPYRTATALVLTLLGVASLHLLRTRVHGGPGAPLGPPPAPHTHAPGSAPAEGSAGQPTGPTSTTPALPDSTPSAGAVSTPYGAPTAAAAGTPAHRYDGLLKNARLLAERQEDLAGNRVRERRLYRTNERHPLILVERVLTRGPAGQAVESEQAMVADHILVESELDETQLAALNQRYGAEIRHHIPGSRVYLISFANPTPDTVAEAVAAYGKSVGPAQPDYVVHTTATPNDPSFSLLNGMHQSNDQDIDAPEAWDYHTGSESVVLMVIDTGINYNHPDLAANCWVNPGEIAGNGLDDDGNGYVDDIRGYDFYNNDNNPIDDHGHGTHCAGTIGAVGNNGAGVAGVCWNVRMIAGKFIGASGYGYSSGAISAIYYATAKGVLLTSNSWGGGPYETLLNNAIADANAHGILFVAAAGNDSTNNEVNPFYPSSYAITNVIAVTATTSSGAQTYNYGATTVDLGAPGTSIYSTYNSGYAYLSGTSMATPHVSGAAALLKAARPDYTGAQIRSILLSTVQPLASLTGKCATGGRLNIGSAMLQAGIPKRALNLVASAAGPTQVNLTWQDAATNETGYVLQRLVGTAGTLADAAGGNNHAQPMPNTTIGPSFQAGGYYQFDGVDDRFLSVDDPADVTGDITVSTWVNAAPASGTQVIASKYSSAEDAGWFIALLANGKVRVDGRAKGGAYYSTPESTAVVRDGTWRLVTFTRTGATWKLYVNGVLQSSSTRGSGSFANTRTLEIGRMDGGSFFFNGALDAFRLYARALSDAEVATLASVGRSASLAAVPSSSIRLFHPMDSAPAEWSPLATLPAGSVSHSDTALQPSTAYSYRLQATHPTGSSGWSNTATASTLSAGGSLPTAPSGLLASSSVSTSVQLTWTDNASNETGFELQRKIGLTSSVTGQLEDHSGSAYHAQPMPAAATGPAFQAGGYYRFDGVDDRFLSVDDAADVTGDITVSAWVNAAPASGTQVIASKYSSAEDAGWFVALLANGKVRVDGRAKGGAYYSTPESTAVVRDGTWRLVTFTRSGSTWKLYVDGSLQSSSARGGGSFANTRTLEIGRLDGGPYPFNGALDAFRLYARALSDAEVSTLASAGRSASLAAVSSTSIRLFHPMDYQPGDWSSLISTAAGATAHTDATVAAQTTYAYRVRAANASGTSDWSNIASVTTPAAGAPPPAAPSALAASSSAPGSVALFWNDNAANETGYEVNRKTGLASSATGQLEDHAGSAHHAQPMPAAATGPAFQAGGYYQFDGVDDRFLSVDDPADVTGDITVSAWVNAAPASGTQVIASKYSSAEDAGWFVVLLANGKVRVDGRAKGGTYYSTPESTAVVRDGTWRLVTFTRTGSTWKLYVNGVLQSSSTRGSGSFANLRTLELGRLDGGQYPFNGALDAFRLYARALSDAEVATLASAGRSASLTVVSASSIRLFHPMDYLPGDWTSLVTAAGGATAHTDATALPGVTYTYRVRALGTTGNSDWSNTATTAALTSAAAVADAEADGIPTALVGDTPAGEPAGNFTLRVSLATPAAAGDQANRIQADGPELTWTSRDGASYAVEFSPSLDQPFQRVAEDLPATPPLNRFLLPDLGTHGFLRVVETR